jgi:hypothetical protein
MQKMPLILSFTSETKALQQEKEVDNEVLQ